MSFKGRIFRDTSVLASRTLSVHVHVLNFVACCKFVIFQSFVLCSTNDAMSTPLFEMAYVNKHSGVLRSCAICTLRIKLRGLKWSAPAYDDTINQYKSISILSQMPSSDWLHWSLLILSLYKSTSILSRLPISDWLRCSPSIL